MFEQSQAAAVQGSRRYCQGVAIGAQVHGLQIPGRGGEKGSRPELVRADFFGMSDLISLSGPLPVEVSAGHRHRPQTTELHCLTSKNSQVAQELPHFAGLVTCRQQTSELKVP